MEIYKIEKLEEVLQQYLHNETTIKTYHVVPFTAVGENYGSLMLSVDVTLNNGDTLKLVAKMCPPNDCLKQLFNTSVSFKKEIAMYSKIIPSLIEFQKKQGICKTIEFVPEFYGARINLNSSEDVDDDAVLLLKNLKVEGFTVVDRMVGFNLEEVTCVLKQLAIFHASPIAVKLLDPDLYKEKIKPYLLRNDLFDAYTTNHADAIIDFVVESLKTNENCVPLLPKVVDALKNSYYNLRNCQEVREPFATISHNDLWVNNILLKFDQSKKIIDSRVVDFQLYSCDSPGNDIVFLLFTSIPSKILREHYDLLLETYYNEFIDTLKNLKCPTHEFSFEALKEEIEQSAKTKELFHLLMMMRHILAKKEKVKELTDLSFEDLTIRSEQISSAYRERVSEIVLEYNRRNWL